MRTRIEQAFRRAARARRAAFIPFIMAGDPTPRRSVELALALARAGADMLELGVPFTDPIADGPTIQRASERALAAGTTLPAALQVVREIRYSSELPIVLFTYYNPVHAHGAGRFAVDAAAAGVDAVLFTDVPAEEAPPLREALAKVGLGLVPLLAPTSTRARIKATKKLDPEFVYFVSRAGTTGARDRLEEGLEDQVRQVRRLTGAPVAVGFGLSSPDQVQRVARFADGVVVGSALIDLVVALGDVPAVPRELQLAAKEFVAATRRR